MIKRISEDIIRENNFGRHTIFLLEGGLEGLKYEEEIALENRFFKTCVMTIPVSYKDYIKSRDYKKLKKGYNVIKVLRWGERKSLTVKMSEAIYNSNRITYTIT